MPVLTTYSVDQLCELWEKCQTQVTYESNEDELIPFDECWIWNKSTANGYPSLSMGHGQSKLKIHMLAEWTKCGEIPTKKQVVSHLCHRKLCINPNHLVIETISENNKRIGCLCSFVDSQKKVWRLCPHGQTDSKYCLRRDINNLPKNYTPHMQ